MKQKCFRITTKHHRSIFHASLSHQSYQTALVLLNTRDIHKHIKTCTSCRRSCAAMALRTFFLLLSCTSPPSSSSSSIKYAFSKLKMISSSHTCHVTLSSYTAVHGNSHKLHATVFSVATLGALGDSQHFHNSSLHSYPCCSYHITVSNSFPRHFPTFG